MDTPRSHIAILAFPFGSHALPLFNLASRLASSLPTAAFSFFTTATSKSSISTLISAATASAPNLSVFTVHDGLPENFIPTGNPEEPIGYFLRANPGNLSKGFELAEAAGLPRIGLIMSDSFLCSAPSLAAEMAVPWISVLASSPTSLVAHIHTQTIRERLGFRDDDDTAAILQRADEFLDFIPAISHLKIGDLPEGIVFGGTKAVFAKLVEEMAQLSPNATAVIFNTFEELDPTIRYLRSHHIKNCIPVGPLNLVTPPALSPDQAHILHWLDCREPASVAYVSFGMIMSLSPSDLTELAEGLAATGRPFLWSLKEQQQQMLPGGFLERIREHGVVVKWAPQIQVLAHVSVGAFVTHCGWNSVLESIAGGVPMLCRPCFGDHRISARMVSDVWKIGITLEDGLTRGGVKKNLELLLGSEEGKAMRSNVGALKVQANSAIRRGGSSFENTRDLVQMISNSSVTR